jgi:hypothetical protein
MNRTILFFRKNFELIFWVSALVLLFTMVPSTEHFTLCPLANLGLSFCPGCGIGHSIHEAMWFDFSASFSSHPLGIFALIIILFRIIKLILKPLKTILL